MLWRIENDNYLLTIGRKITEYGLAKGLENSEVPSPPLVVAVRYG